MILGIISPIPIDAIRNRCTRLIPPLAPRLDCVAAYLPDSLAPHDIFERQCTGVVHHPFRYRLALRRFHLQDQKPASEWVRSEEWSQRAQEIDTHTTIRNHHICRHACAMIA